MTERFEMTPELLEEMLVYASKKSIPISDMVIDRDKVIFDMLINIATRIRHIEDILEEHVERTAKR